MSRTPPPPHTPSPHPEGPSTPSSPAGFVRPARPGDAEPIAQLQQAVWAAAAAGRSLPADVLGSLDLATMTHSWEQAVSAPPSARHHVLIAWAAGPSGRQAIVGVSSLAPGQDPDHDPDRDAEVVELAVHPAHRGAGHGSRLLAAAAEVLAGDGFSTAHHWVPDQDEDRAAFLASAGWASDGARRTWDLYGDGQVLLTELRWHAALDPAPAATAAGEAR